jgi:hypothetical protein
MSGLCGIMPVKKGAAGVWLGQSGGRDLFV